MTTDTNGVREDIRRHSVQAGDAAANAYSSPGAFEALVFSLSTIADTVPRWGSEPIRRDAELRQFWPSEPILASALYSIVIRNAAFSWTLEGPPLTVSRTQHMLNTADFGKGWLAFATKLGIDLLSQDNGAFFEIIRMADSPDSPAVGIAHLDSSRCLRTGNPEEPVIYTDLQGRFHRLKWYQVQELVELPSPIASMRGMQLCAVSRVLRAAQYLRDIGVYLREKVSGDNPNAIHIISGVKSDIITAQLAEHRQAQSEKGMVRFIIPAIVSTLDPTATIGHEQIDLKTLPDGFNLDDAMRWYINQLALGFGADYQDFAPLPGRALGSSTQSLVLHMKSRGKGPAFFMKTLEYAFNFQGIMPQNVTFVFDEQDIEEDVERSTTDKVKAETLAILTQSGILTSQAAQQILLDEGMINEEIFNQLMEGQDVTPDIVAIDTEPVLTGEAARHLARNRRRRKRKPMTPGYSDKQTESDEAVAEFGEDVRLEMEKGFEEVISKVLEDTFDDFQRRIGFKAKLLMLARKQAEPTDVLADAEFWENFRTRAVTAGASLSREGALKVADFNAGLGLSVNFDLVNQDVLAFSRTYTTEWWARLADTTANQLRGAIVTWQEQGLGRAGLPDLVKALEPTFGRKRAALIAATETTQIFDEGNRIAHNAAGIALEEWQTVEDSLVDDICRPLNGQRFPTNEGPRPVKDTHIGCRCARLPVGSSGQTIGAGTRA